MVWIIVAATLNTLWTLWCVQLLPPRVATHFGLSGQADGWMSRKGFALFGILFPLALAAFLVFIGGQVRGGMSTQMEHLAAVLIVFFSLISWTIVRSNRRNPPRIDYPSLLLSIGILIIYTIFWVSGLPKGLGQANLSSTPLGKSQK